MEITSSLIAHANPVPRGSLEPSPSSLEALFAGIVAEPPARRRRWTRKRTFVVAFAVMAVAIATAVGATYSTHTGVLGLPHKTENDTSEYLRVDAPDFPPLALKLARGIPFPPGDSAKTYLRFLIRPHELRQVTGVKGQFAFDAMCAWQGYWLEAHRNGDVAKEAAAVRVLRAIPTWPAITAVDSGTALYASFAADAAAGKAARIQYFWNVNCKGLPEPWSGK